MRKKFSSLSNLKDPPNDPKECRFTVEFSNFCSIFRKFRASRKFFLPKFFEKFRKSSRKNDLKNFKPRLEKIKYLLVGGN